MSWGRLSKSKGDKADVLMRRETPVEEYHTTYEGRKIDAYVFHTQESLGFKSDYKQVPHEYLVSFIDDDLAVLKSYTGNNFGQGKKELAKVRATVEKGTTPAPKPIPEAWQMTEAEHVKLIFDAVQAELRKGVEVPIPSAYKTTWLNKPEQIRFKQETPYSYIWVYQGRQKGEEVWDRLPSAVLDSWAEKLGLPLLIDRYRNVEQALKEGKPVSVEIIKQFPLWEDLMALSKRRKPTKPKPAPTKAKATKSSKAKPKKAKKTARELPPDAQNVQQLTFDSELFTCYGKPVRQGYRAYCRRNK